MSLANPVPAAEIFKAYDIRGVYPSQINEQGAGAIALALGNYLKKRSHKKRLKLLIARDVRKSSPSLVHYVREGIMNAGCDVVDAGIITTPMIYFLMGKLAVDGGIMVTASHNPAEYNGLKIFGAKLAAIGEGTGMEEVKALAAVTLNVSTFVPPCNVPKPVMSSVAAPSV